MGPALTLQPQSTQRDNDIWIRAGRWLFKRRSWLPWPLLIPIVLLPPSSPAPAQVGTGLALIAIGELIRLWAVRHIGVISRTRAERLGPLVVSGPFRFVRNPLYIGNVALWAGFGIAAGLPRTTILFVALILVEYHAIVRWEERLLEERLGESYRVYARRVPRWIPRWPRAEDLGAAPARFAWRDAIFSERGTLIALAAACAWLFARRSM
jgi:protein-S-isoprenylcysteine O-methyltransferase Ste14